MESEAVLLRPRKVSLLLPHVGTQKEGVCEPGSGSSSDIRSVDHGPRGFQNCEKSISVVSMPPSLCSFVKRPKRIKVQVNGP